jgi:hypothetical protein
VQPYLCGICLQTWRQDSELGLKPFDVMYRRVAGENKKQQPFSQILWAGGEPIDYDAEGLENAIDLRCFCSGNTVPRR